MLKKAESLERTKQNGANGNPWITKFSDTHCWLEEELVRLRDAGVHYTHVAGDPNLILINSGGSRTKRAFVKIIGHAEFIVHRTRRFRPVE